MARQQAIIDGVSSVPTKRKRSRSQPNVWIPTVILESLLIVVSILVALWLDGRQEDRELQELMNRSVLSFENELTKNKNQLADVYPYHAGLRSVLMELGTRDTEDKIPELRNILDGVQLGVLFNNAWETALATGSLTRMDYELVSALSLTYSMQKRFEDLYAVNIKELTTITNQTGLTVDSKIFVANRFMRDMIEAESLLDIYYDEALVKIDEYLRANDVTRETN